MEPLYSGNLETMNGLILDGYLGHIEDKCPHFKGME